MDMSALSLSSLQFVWVAMERCGGSRACHELLPPARNHYARTAPHGRFNVKFVH